jgi:hypothetical protein
MSPKAKSDEPAAESAPSYTVTVVEHGANAVGAFDELLEVQLMARCCLRDTR